MDIKYEDYLDRGTRRIMELFSSAGISTEERDAIVSAFTDELAGSITDTGSLRDYDLLIYSASVRFVDGEISRILSKENASYSDYEAGIKYCTRQQQSFSLFRKNGWTLPVVENSSPERCAELFQKKQESISIGGKILDEDKRIDELIAVAERELSVSVCNQATDLINELDQDISVCKQKRMPVPAINNKDTRKALRRVAEIKNNAEQKEATHREIFNTDLKIDGIVSNMSSMPDQWRNLISLCQKQTDLLAECKTRRWPLPAVRHNQPERISEQYRHYIGMLDLDSVITRERDSLSTNKQYKEFFGHCNTQQENMSVCVRNGWNIPNLANPDPGSLSNAIHAEKSRKDKRKRFKKRLYLTGALVVAVAVLILIGIGKYRAGKVEIPFDASYAVGQNQASIYKELEDAGFKSITKKQDESGWLKENEVISVTIDNSDSFSKGSYREPEVSVVITYSSGNRVYVTDLLKDWKKTEYTAIEKALKDAGFSNITLKEVTTSDKQIDGLAAAVTLDGESYTNEHCYLSKNAPIIISYYALQIGIGNDSAQFIGQDYEKVVASLKESGFTNVQTQQVTTGLAKGNTVVGVTVNNVDTYNSSESFAPDVKIVVKYSSNDRVDITETLKNWQSTDYEKLVSLLKAKGFATVKVTPIATEKKTQNRLASGIKLNNEEFIAGECYLPKTASIEIKYYSLQIKIGQTAKQFEKNQMYSDVVKQLQSQGFTNIRLQRANDIGWFPIHDKEGTIKKFTINDSRDFAETDKFSYDAEIIIVVHTREGKGCEDITEIAD